MRKVIAMCSSVCFAMAGMSGQASGQVPTTTTPTPTTTPVPTPSASVLLHEMDQALTARNTYHIVATGQFSTADKSTKAAITQVGDVSQKPSASRSVSTTKETINLRGQHLTSKSSLTTIQVGKHLAMRGKGPSGQTNWLCGPSTPSRTSTVISAFPAGTLAEPLGPMDQLGPVARVIGPDTVNGVPVWHVRASETSPAKGKKFRGKQDKVTVDVFVSQADFTPLREETSLLIHVSPSTLKMQETATFSQFGEALRIALPKACKK